MMLILSASAKRVDSISIKHVDSLLELSRSASVAMDTHKSVEYAAQALRNSRAVDYQFGLLRANYYIGQMLFYSGYFDESLRYLSQGEKLSIAREHPQILSQIFKVKGMIYISLELVDNSIKEFRKASAYAGQIIPESNSAYVLSQIYENMHHAFNSLNELDSAYFYLDKSRKYLEAIDESKVFPHLVNNYSSLGYYYFTIDDFVNSEKFYNKALDVAARNDYPYISRTQMYLGDLFYGQKLFDKAIFHYNTSLRNLEERRLESELPALYARFERVFESVGNSDSVVYYKDKRVVLENKLSNTKVSAAKDVFEILLEEELSQSNKKSKVIIIVIVVIVLIISLIISWFIIRRNRKQLTDIYERESLLLKTELNAASVELVQLAKDNDPTFIARFKELYPNLYRKLSVGYKELTSSDMQFCALVFLNFSTKDIADINFHTIRTVLTKRSRLRKKMNLDPNVDLYEFLHSLNNAT